MKARLLDDIPRPRRGSTIMCDLDGTLVRTPHGRRWTPRPRDLAAMQVYRNVAHRLKGLERRGFGIEFLTGRPRSLRRVSERHVAEAGFPGAPIWDQDEWRGLPLVRPHKARHLAREGVVLHIADMADDLAASLDAGVPFLHADDFAAGHDLDHFFCTICGCTSLRACTGGCSWTTPYTCSTCRRNP